MASNNGNVILDSCWSVQAGVFRLPAAGLTGTDGVST